MIERVSPANSISLGFTHISGMQRDFNLTFATRED